MVTFSDLGLNPEIIKALDDLGFETPTEIQQKSIPHLIESKADLKAFAQTGTGKTAAFSLPIIEMLTGQEKDVQAIILSPTRELAVQIGNNIADFTKYLPNIKVLTVYGGANIEEQIRGLRKRPQIVVGTPGRTVDLIKRGILKLKGVKWLILDEADEMLNMGFKDELDQVLEATPVEKQTLLFSATFPREVENIARNYMHEPVEISSGAKNAGSDNVENDYYIVRDSDRYKALKRIADVNPNVYGIVFCRTRRETKEVADRLIQDGYSADALHGDLSQAQRDSVMQKFRKKTIQILVATDVAARGLDVTNLTHVINYKLPDQIETYTHRSGRTGRAGKEGTCVTLLTKREVSKLKPIEKRIGKKFVKKEVPTGEEICRIQLMSVIDKINNTPVNEEQIEPFLENIYEKLANLDREELIKKFVSVEFNSFLEYYENSNDINDKSAASPRRQTDENMTRFFINIGRKDQVTPPRLMGLINEHHQKNDIEIGQIEILDKFSFFEIDSKYADKTLEVFKGVEFEGRRVGVEITKNQRGEGGGRNRRSRPRGASDSDRSRGKSRSGRGDRNRGSRSDSPSSGFGRKRSSGSPFKGGPGKKGRR
ncbi:MAG: DEAD/DEAH box helicase [Flavobacteriaceae bacterium]